MHCVHLYVVGLVDFRDLHQFVIQPRYSKNHSSLYHHDEWNISSVMDDWLWLIESYWVIEKKKTTTEHHSFRIKEYSPYRMAWYLFYFNELDNFTTHTFWQNKQNHKGGPNESRRIKNTIAFASPPNKFIAIKKKMKTMAGFFRMCVFDSDSNCFSPVIENVTSHFYYTIYFLLLYIYISPKKNVI